MKKHVLLIIFCFVAIIAQTQQVQRNKIIVEIGTGTWWYYCPGSALGAEDLIANGKQVAIIEYHNGDSYTNAAGTARQNYYNLSGTPTAWFDGGNAVVGGNHTQSLYSSYLPKYNQRIAINSSFTIQLYGTNSGNNYNILAIINKVASYTGPDPILHLVLTQSNIQFNWQGLSELNFVERLMAPNQNGTAINFFTNNEQTVSLSFSKGLNILSGETGAGARVLWIEY